MSKSHYKKRLLYSFLFLVLLINAVAAMHAWHFTHFSEQKKTKTKDPAHISPLEKIRILLTGISNPRPQNTQLPAQPYATLKLPGNKSVESWLIHKDSAKGTVIVFHGYSGHKSSMLDQATIFLQSGYRVLLVDFMGSGGSEGNQTTLGYKEAENVKTCYDYISAEQSGPVYLYGTSMGAVAILKAISDYRINPSGIILECPFGSMYETVCARFRIMGVPAFPMAGLLVFWGGLENGFPAYDFRPVDDAAAVHCPTLLLYGEQDDKVSRTETDAIFSRLSGPKRFRSYPLAGHENYLLQYRSEWTRDVQDFLSGRE
jgi:uncharacterized protein